MNRDLKSIFYAFVAQDIEVYTPDDKENCLLINKLICNECGAFWHTSLLECYFCSEINYYIYACTSCGEIYSITNSSIKCVCENSNSRLVKKCMNPECISNTDSDIARLTIIKKGVFALGSSFNLSLMHCINCGGRDNRYQSYVVYVMNVDKGDDLSKFIESNSVEKDSVIIFKHHNESHILYGFIIYGSLEKQVIDLKFSSISSIVDILFP